jgi:hypothetical protein
VALTAEVTGLSVDHADGSFAITYEVRDADGNLLAEHSQGFPGSTERATVEEAVENYVRDIVPHLLTQPPVALGDTILCADPSE